MNIEYKIDEILKQIDSAPVANESFTTGALSCMPCAIKPDKPKRNRIKQWRKRKKINGSKTND